jgi:hypothetical protein
MKIKNITIVGTLNILNSFADKKLPQKISYAITRNLMLFQKEYQYYEVEMKKLEAKYDGSFIHTEKGEITRDQRGIPILSTDQEQEAYNKELYELLNIEIDIPVYYIDSEEFNYDNDAEKYDIMSASDILTLQSVLCDN